MSRLTRALRGWAPVALILVIADQLTKHWAVNALDDRNIDIFWTLRFNLSFNTGMAFGQAQGLGPIIAVVAMVVIVGLLLSVKREVGPAGNLAVGMVIGGAVGNLIDRIFRDPAWLRGAVVDFVDLQWFPIFNVADAGITIGGILLVASAWWAGRTDVAEEALGDRAADADEATDRVDSDVGQESTGK